MPIVSIELVVESPSDPEPDGAQALADDLGRVFDSDRGETWVRLDTLPRTRYAENDRAVPEAVSPTFVSVLLATVPGEARLASLAAAITSVVARTLGRPAENVHVCFEPPAAGRIAFGGTLQGDGTSD